MYENELDDDALLAALHAKGVDAVEVCLRGSCSAPSAAGTASARLSVSMDLERTGQWAKTFRDRPGSAALRHGTSPRIEAPYIRWEN